MDIIYICWGIYIIIIFHKITVTYNKIVVVISPAKIRTTFNMINIATFY